jgi:hypothetical protein
MGVNQSSNRVLDRGRLLFFNNLILDHDGFLSIEIWPVGGPGRAFRGL